MGGKITEKRSIEKPGLPKGSDRLEAETSAHTVKEAWATRA